MLSWQALGLHFEPGRARGALSRPTAAGPAGRSAAARPVAFPSLSLRGLAFLTRRKPTIFRSQRLATSYLARTVTSQPEKPTKIPTLKIQSNTWKFTEFAASSNRRGGVQIP